MPITTNLVFDEAKLSIANQNINLATDTLKAILLDTTFTPNAGTDQFLDAGGGTGAVAARVAGTTDQTIGSRSLAKDTTGHFAYLAGAPVTFAAVPTGVTVAGLAIYKDTGVATTSKLIAVFDITDIPTNGGDITIQWANNASGGVLKLA